MNASETLAVAIEMMIEEKVNAKFAGKHFNSDDGQKYFSINEACKYIKTSRTNFYKMRKDGVFDVPLIIYGDQQVYDRDDLDRWMLDHKK